MSFVPYPSKLLVVKMVCARAEMTLCFPKLAYVGQTVKIVKINSKICKKIPNIEYSQDTIEVEMS